MALVNRLQHVGGNLPSSHINEHDAHPIFVQAALLRLVFRDSVGPSVPWTACRPIDLYFMSKEMYWQCSCTYVFHSRNPALHEVGQYVSIPSQDDEDDYHTLLVLTWVFAESAGQTLQTCLLASESGTKMRSTLLELALWLEKHNRPSDDVCEHAPHPRLQPYVDPQEIQCVGADLKEARVLWNIRDDGEDNERCRRRPSAERY